MLQDKIKIFTTTIAFILIVSFFAFAARKIETNFRYPKLVVSKEQSTFNFKSNYIGFLSLGHSRLISSILWITTLLESDIEHYKGDENSWMFKRFMTISSIDPHFYQNYLLGGQYLSIIKDDIHGADELYSLGIKVFPNDFWLNYHAGFNAVFELEDIKLGLKYYETIINHPLAKEKSLTTLYNKIRFHNGDFTPEEVFENLKIILESSRNTVVAEKIKFDLYSLKAEKDLECLNTGTTSCDKFDYLGDPYIYFNGVWGSKHQWKPYRFNRIK